jgi:toxin HigB-1
LAYSRPKVRLAWYAVDTIYRIPEVGVAVRKCADKRTERFLANERVREFEGFARAAQKALTKLQAAVTLGDLRFPPSNRFEALKGTRNGQYSIRINDQWRVCFRWTPHEPPTAEADALMIEGDAYDVEITDYH